jgi:hypothetical protein
LNKSAIIGVSIAGLLVTVAWIDLLMVYKRVVIAVRRGNVDHLPSYFSWLPDKAVVSKAPAFVGIQAMGTVISFLVFSIIFTLFSYLLTAKIVQDFLRDKLLSWIGWAALSVFLINFLRVSLLKYIATNNGDISLRALFSILDIYFMFFNLVTGAIVAFTRFLILVPFFFVLIMRPDIQVLPKDPAAGAYCSLLLLDIRYNNPIAKCTNEVFRQILHEVRVKRQLKKSSMRDLRSIVLNPLNAVSKPLSVTSNTDSNSSKSQRFVNKWWLFAMLASHPELIPFRHREKDTDASNDDNATKLSSATDDDKSSIEPSFKDEDTKANEGNIKVTVNTEISKNSGAFQKVLTVKEW